MQTLLAYTKFKYVALPKKTFQLGGIIDRDFYPNYNPYDEIAGEKIKIIKIWMQSAARVRDGSYNIFKIPMEILINIDFYPMVINDWVNNRTEIDCTSLQGYSSGIKCTLLTIVCTRNYLSPIKKD